MRHYDLHVVYEEGEFEALVREARVLGFSGLAIEVSPSAGLDLYAEILKICERNNVECFIRVDVNKLHTLSKILKIVGRGRVLVSYTHTGGRIDAAVARKVDLIDVRGDIPARSIRLLRNVNPYVALEVERRVIMHMVAERRDEFVTLIETLRRGLTAKLQIVAASGATKWYQLLPPAQLSYTVATLLDVKEKPKRFTQLALRAILRLMEGG